MPVPTIQKVEEMFDVIVVGAGPSALAVVARLLEPLPSALYTDVEHQRFTWLHRHGSDVKTRTHRHLKASKQSASSSEESGPKVLKDIKILVLDSSGGDWLSTWKALFSAYTITSLRSPMFFHPDPSEVDSMLAYAHTQNRAHELTEITGVVGRETTKNQIKRKRYV